MCLLLTGSYLNNQCHKCDHCYAAGTPGLELSYTFSNDHDHRVPDLSGNGRDGTADTLRLGWGGRWTPLH